MIKVCSGTDKIMIAGDFNCNMINRHSNNNLNTRTLQDLIDIYQLQQHINMPTRTTIKSKTLIDIITKIDDTKTIQSGVIELGISDHNLVYICRKIGIPKQEP